MRKVTFIVSLILYLSNGYSQTLSHSIEYGISFNREPGLVKDKSEYSLFGRLVFNDTFSFYYNVKSPKDLTSNEIQAKKVFHHSYHSKPPLGFYASGASFGLKRPVWILSAGQINWTPNDETKTILGYECMSAVFVDSGKNIILAYYTTALPPQFGPMGYAGLPGTILEILHPQYGRYIVATKITRGKFNLILPEKISVLTNAEFQKIRRPAIEPTVTIRKF